MAAIRIDTGFNLTGLQKGWSIIDKAIKSIGSSLGNIGQSISKAFGTTKVDKTTAEIERLNKSAYFADRNLTLVKKELNEVGEQEKEVKKVNKSFDGLTSTIGKAVNRIKSLLVTVLIFNVMRKALTEFRDYMSLALKGNEAFANSFAQVKGNLLVAFQPIIDTIIPILATLMSWLRGVTQAFAQFTNMLFGRSIKASTNSAKALNDQAQALKGVNKQAKNATNTLDELALVSKETGGDTGAIAPEFAEIPEPDMTVWERFKELLQPIEDALGRLWEQLQPFAENVGKGLRWFYDNVLVPLGKWTIGKVLPAFIDILSGALQILNTAIEDLEPIFQWFWDNFLAPIAEWTGGIIVDILNGIADALVLISENEVAMAILEGIAVAIGLVAGALVLYNVAMGIATGITTLFGTAMKFITGPIGIAIGIIGAIIAIGILLYKNWDKITEFASNLWGNIKNIFGKIGDFIGDVFKGIINGAIGMVNFVIKAIETMANALISPFNVIIKGLNLIPGVDIPELRITLPKIPKLATGDVVNPGKEFMAILGDNKTEKEVVSPLSTIEQAVDNALARRGNNGTSEEELLLMREQNQLLMALLNKPVATFDGRDILASTENASSNRGIQTGGGAFANEY